MAKQILAALEIADPKNLEQRKWVSITAADRARGIGAYRIILFREPTEYEKEVLEACLFEGWGSLFKVEKLLQCGLGIPSSE